METNEQRWWEIIERPGKNFTIKKIEARTEKDIIGILLNHQLGLSRKRRFNDYSRAKKLCFEGLFINSEIYDKQIRWICDYLKL